MLPTSPFAHILVLQLVVDSHHDIYRSRNSKLPTVVEGKDTEFGHQSPGIQRLAAPSHKGPKLVNGKVCLQELQLLSIIIILSVKLLSRDGKLYKRASNACVNFFLQGVFFFCPPPNFTKSQALYNLNWPPLKFSKYRNL